MVEKGRIADEVFTANSKEELLLAFKSRNYLPISIEEKKASIGSIEIGRKHLNKKSLTLFCRQMSTMLRSGVPLIQSFDVLASQTEDKILKNVLLGLSSDVQSGMPLSEAMLKQDDQFPPILAKMVEVGEATGDISNILDRMATQYESEGRTARKIRGALTYPIVLMVVAIAACVFMLIKIVPQFADVFSSLGAELPFLTRMLMSLSDFIVNKWYILLIALPLVILIIIRIFKTEKVAFWVDKQKLSMKMLKGPMQKIMASNFARTLYTLISCGIPIVQALEHTKKNVNNRYANSQIDEIIIGVQQGKGLSEQMANYPIFPKLLVSMIAIGESSGNLEDMLSKTADYYDEEMDAAIAQITSLIEPIMILIVGILIGGIVLALYAPMFEMITAMQNSI